VAQAALWSITDAEARKRHMLMLGKSGSGKSNLMLSMMIQDLAADRGFMLLDPFGKLTNDFLAHVPPERQNDVVFFDLMDKSLSEKWRQ